MWFSNFARKTSIVLGHPLAFSIAFLTIVIWAVLGPFLQFSDTWQLTINTGTTIVTFLMVFLIQNTQNRDSIAVQIKLNEIISAIRSADNRLLDTEKLTEADLRDLLQRYHMLAEDTSDS